MTGIKGERGESEQPALRGVLPAGTSLRGYELKSILGQGAFGITYRAHDLTLHRDVAVKEYLPTALALREGRTTVLPRSPDHAEQFAWGRDRFLDEARTLARLDRTPAIVRVHDFLEANGTAYMVMALIEGETLNRQLSREQRLAPDVLERLLFPLLDGLEEVHAIGFLHRDIKPANIMVDPLGRPTLIDFGASRAAMAERSTTLTAIFTPGYAAAEQFTSSNLGPWSDIYGLAATLYHAITGRIPPSSIERILKDTYQPLTELQPAGYAEGLLAAIDAGMAIRVDDRPQSIAEWRSMLRSATGRSAAQEATQLARRPGPLARTARRVRRAGARARGAALWGAAAAVILSLSGAGYLAFTANAPTTVGTAALNLSAEQLEQALAERRKADTLATEKRRLEEQARQKAEADAEAKRQADAELEQARQARQKAEQELAQLKADIEARRQADPGQRDQAAAAVERAVEEAAQRKAEADAAALREAEDDARKKAEADAEAKRQADQALAVAEAQRKQAEADARAKAETETAARRQSSEEAQRKAEAEAANRRQADEAQARAQAEREKAEAEAKIKADAKAEADKVAATLAQLKEEAEAAEKSLRLEPADRERLQLALSSLTFDTRGADGILGPRSREMIAAWQKARNQPPTGFLDAAQQQALLKEATAALSKHDERRKAEEDAKARPVPAAAASTPGNPPSASSDGLWRGTFDCGSDGGARPFSLDLGLRVSNGSGVWYPLASNTANQQTHSVEVSVDGPNVTVIRRRVAGRADEGYATLTGRFDGSVIRASGSSCEMMLTRDGSPMAANVAAAAPFPGSSLPDGTYSGALQLGNTIFRFSLPLTNGNGTGSVTRPGCGPAPLSLRVDPSGSVTGEATITSLQCNLSVRPVTGRVEGRRLLVSLQAEGTAFQQVSLALDGATPPALASPDGLWRGIYTCTGTGAVPLSMALEPRLTDGTGTWYPPNSSAANDFTASVTITVDGPNVTALRRMVRTSIVYNSTLAGRYDGNTIEANNNACTLSLARGGSPGVAAVAPVTPPSPPSIQPATSTYDGSYSGRAQLGGYTGMSTATNVSLTLASGRGTGTIATPGCSPSSFSLSVSSTGSASGEGYLNCVLVNGSNTISAGAFTVSGTHTAGKFNLRFTTPRDSFAATLSQGAAASPSLASPDGRWRGTYECEAAIGSSISVNPSFAFPLDISLAGGSGSWKNNDANVAYGSTLEIRISVDRTTATLERYAVAPGTGRGLNTPATLSGQYDGNTILIMGRELVGGRLCKLALTRA